MVKLFLNHALKIKRVKREYNESVISIFRIRHLTGHLMLPHMMEKHGKFFIMFTMLENHR